MMRDEIFDVQNQAEEPIQAGDFRISPFSQSWRLKLPGLQTLFTWKRPVSVLVESPDGNQEVLAIQDITRQVQLSLLAASLISGVVFWIIGRQRRRSTSAPVD